MYALLYLKWIADKDLLYSTGNSIQCYAAAWMGGGFGWEWIHVYTWLSPFAIHLKLSQHQLAILQYKVKNLKTKKKSSANFFLGTILFNPQNNSYKINVIIILISKLENWGSRRTVICTALFQGTNLSTVLPF